MNNTKKKNKKRFYMIAASSALLCLITAICYCKYSGSYISDAASLRSSSGAENDRKNQLEKFKKRIWKLMLDYEAENAESFRQFEAEIARAGMVDFQQAHENIVPTVNHFGEFNVCGHLIYAMARDRVKHSSTAREFIIKRLETPVIAPCVAGASKINDALCNFMHKLAENSNRFSVECMDGLKAFPKDDPDFAAAKKYVEDLNDFCIQVEQMTASAGFTAIGAAFEAICWKQTFHALVRITNQAVAKITGSATAPFLDGPFPVGDMIAVAGFSWCMWDIYQLTRVLPDDMKKCLSDAINSFAAGCRQEALEKARKAYLDSMFIMNGAAKKIMEVKL